MTHTKDSAPFKNISQFFYDYDPAFICFKDWVVLPYLQGHLPSEVYPNETVVFLDHLPIAPPVSVLDHHIPVTLKNNGQGVVLNLSILFRETGRQVFFLRELAPNRSVPLELIRTGSYELIYNWAWTQHTERRLLRATTHKKKFSARAL